MVSTIAPPETCVCTALRQAARRMSQHFDIALASTGIGVNQYAVLARLKRIGPRSIQDLAAAMVMDRSTLGHLLRPLEARGLVAIETAAGDRRRRRIVLTPAGLGLVDAAFPLWAATQRQFERSFGEAPAQALREVLAAVARIDFGAADRAMAGSSSSSTEAGFRGSTNGNLPSGR